MRQIEWTWRLRAGATVMAMLAVSSTAWASEPSPLPLTQDDVAQAEVPGTVPEDPRVDVTEELEATEEDDEFFPSSRRDWSVSGSFRASSSMGHLFRPATEARSGVAGTFSLSGSYRLTSQISTSLSLSYLQFLSRYGGSQERYEGRFQDISLSVAHGSLYLDDLTGINVSGSLSGIIPTGATSRFSGLRTNVGAGLTLSRGVGPVSLSWSNSLSKNWHRYTSIVVDLDRYPVDALARADSVEQITATRIALTTGLLTSHSWTTSGAVSWRTPLSGLSLSSSLGFSNAWTYNNGTIDSRDEFTSDNARVGRGWRQSISSSFSANYRFLDRYSAGLSLMTAQPPRTADNRRVRFPFYDTQSGNLQYTSIAVSLSGTY